MADRPFARVYYADLERDYPTIWRDDAALATYARLLSVAEGLWPAIPEVPRSARSATVKVLIQAGLLIAVPPFSYRIKGMEAERIARSEHARIAANIRHGNAPRSAPSIAPSIAPSNASGNAREMPSQPYQPIQPTHAQSAPKKGGVLIDERNLTEDEMKRRYDERMLRQTGVKL